MEFIEQLAYDRIDPLPDPWRQTASMLAMIHNCARAFLPESERRKVPPLDPEAMLDRRAPKSMTAMEFLRRHRGIT